MTDPAIDRATFDRLLDITGGDLDFLDELVDTYLADGTVQVGSLRAAADAGDVEALIRPAHTLKSSSDNIGALELAASCRSLEADARAGAVDDAADRVTAIEMQFATASAALRRDRTDRT